MITVLLADDHALVRRGFRRMLEDDPGIEVVAEASNGAEAVELAQKFRPTVIVMDYAMPGLDGVQATHEIRRHFPEARILILSMHADDNYIRNAIDAGAIGYMLKNAVDIDLAAAVRKIAGGEMVGVPAPQRPTEDKYDDLTPREKQILQLIAQGNSNKDIAQLLGLSVNTVSVHRANLMDTLNIHRTAELVLYAIRRGIVSPR